MLKVNILETKKKNEKGKISEKVFNFNQPVVPRCHILKIQAGIFNVKCQPVDAFMPAYGPLLGPLAIRSNNCWLMRRHQ